MDVLIWIGGIAAVVGLIAAAVRVQAYSAERYGFRPFSGGSVLACIGVVILMLVAAWTAPEGVPMSDVAVRMVTLDWTGISNAAVALLAAILLAGATYWHVGRHSNAFVAAFAVTGMLVASALAGILIVLYAMFRPKRRED